MPEVVTQPPGGDRGADQASTAKRQAEERVRSAVLLALGTPPDLFKVDVRRVWERHYRVNVWIGEKVHCTRVVHTYFVAIDDRGAIKSSSPRIQREYL